MSFESCFGGFASTRSAPAAMGGNRTSGCGAQERQGLSRITTFFHLATPDQKSRNKLVRSGFRRITNPRDHLGRRERVFDRRSQCLVGRLSPLKSVSS